MPRMTLDTVIMGMGAFVALVPFLGFPGSWYTPLLVLCGIGIVALGIVVRRRGTSSSSQQHERPDA